MSYIITYNHKNIMTIINNNNIKTKIHKYINT